MPARAFIRRPEEEVRIPCRMGIDMSSAFDAIRRISILELLVMCCCDDLTKLDLFVYCSLILSLDHIYNVKGTISLEFKSFCV